MRQLTAIEHSTPLVRAHEFVASLVPFALTGINPHHIGIIRHRARHEIGLHAVVGEPRAVLGGLVAREPVLQILVSPGGG